jgi:hypothetical protein
VTLVLLHSGSSSLTFSTPCSSKSPLGLCVAVSTLPSSSLLSVEGCDGGCTLAPRGLEHGGGDIVIDGDPPGAASFEVEKNDHQSLYYSSTILNSSILRTSETAAWRLCSLYSTGPHRIMPTKLWRIRHHVGDATLCFSRCPLVLLVLALEHYPLGCLSLCQPSLGRTPFRAGVCVDGVANAILVLLTLLCLPAHLPL